MEPFPSQFINMQNLSDITLPGFIIKLCEMRNRLTFDDIIREVSIAYPTLRRSDGSKYTGNIEKTVRACLSSLDVFKEVENGFWTIRNEQAKLYQEKTTEKLKTILSGKKIKKIGLEGKIQAQEIDAQDAVANSKKADKLKPKRRYKRKCEKYEQMYNLLDDCSKVLKADEKTKYLIDNPFKRVKDNDTANSLWKKLGPERMLGIVQCFEYFSPAIHDYIKKKNSEKAHTDKKISSKKEKKN